MSTSSKASKHEPDLKSSLSHPPDDETAASHSDRRANKSLIAVGRTKMFLIAKAAPSHDSAPSANCVDWISNGLHVRMYATRM